MKTAEHATASRQPTWLYICNTKSFKTVTNGSVICVRVKIRIPVTFRVILITR